MSDHGIPQARRAASSSHRHSRASRSSAPNSRSQRLQLRQPYEGRLKASSLPMLNKGVGGGGLMGRCLRTRVRPCCGGLSGLIRRIHMCSLPPRFGVVVRFAPVLE